LIFVPARQIRHGAGRTMFKRWAIPGKVMVEIDGSSRRDSESSGHDNAPGRNTASCQYEYVVMQD
jgi:hypothetical protein